MILVAAALVSLYAVVGFFVVPAIARAQIVRLARTTLHRKAAVARVTFNPFTLAGSIEGFDLEDRDGAPLFKVDRVAMNLQISGLLRRAWRFREITIDGPSLDARVLSDGRLSLADLLEAEAPPEPNAKKSALPRLIVGRFALHRGRIGFVDASRSPRFAQVFEPLDLEVNDLTTIPDESGDHAVTIGLGKNSLLRWSGKQTVEPLHLEGRVEITGVALARLWEYVAPSHPLVVSDGRADVGLDYHIRQAADGSLAVSIQNATVKARGLIVRPRAGSENWLELPSAEMSQVEAAWPECKAAAAVLQITDPKVLVRRDANGVLNWMAAIPPAAPKAEGTRSWAAAIAAVHIRDGTILVDDLAVAPPVKTTVSGLGVRLSKLSTDLSVPVKTEITAAINSTGRASVSGTIVPDPQSADLDLVVANLDLTPFQSYAVRLPGADIRSGIAALSGRLRVTQGTPQIEFDGKGAVTALAVAGAGEDRLLAWDRAEARGVRATVSPVRVRVSEVEVDGAFLKLRIDREGKVNLSSLGRPAGDPAPPERPSSDPAPPERPSRDPAPPEKSSGDPAPPRRPASAPLPLDIGKIVFKSATADYTDESLILPFGTKIHDLNGHLRDLSTTAAAPARLDLEGRVADAGYVKADGTLRVVDPFQATDIKVIFRNVNMHDLTPYTAQFAGYSVETGVLDLDVRYRVENRHLIGDHHVVAKDLILGPKVEGAKGPGLAVRLAVALLKDKDGRIDLAVPIEGTVDSPEFSYRGIFWQAFKTILANVVKAPFRAIGHLFGADREDLELVGFVSGRSDLPPPEQDTLAKLATELAHRSEISLEIEGRFDPVTDVDALQHARLEARIDAKRTPEASLDAILESLYIETFSQQKLDATRLEFMPAPEAPSPTGSTHKKRKKEEQTPPPSQTREAFDASAFYERLRKELLEAERIDTSDLVALAGARAGAIEAALSAGGLDPSRVKILDPAQVKRKKQGSDLVASEMTMNAED